MFDMVEELAAIHRAVESSGTATTEEIAGARGAAVAQYTTLPS